jgi:hypothetical protein
MCLSVPLPRVTDLRSSPGHSPGFYVNGTAGHPASFKLRPFMFGPYATPELAWTVGMHHIRWEHAGSLPGIEGR